MKKKTLLFVCVQNSCRSQMAEGLARVLGKDIVEPYSAGSKPASIINPKAVKVMQEKNIDISRQKPKGFEELPFEKFDYVVTLGCGEQCPFVEAKHRVDWIIKDPKGRDMAFFRKVRDEITLNLLKLMDDIRTPAQGKGSHGKTF